MDSFPTTITPTRQSKETDKHLEDFRSKNLPKPQLKSNIPKPVPYVRITREPRSKSCSSPSFNGSTTLVYTPTTLKQRSLSQSFPTLEHHQLTNKAIQSKQSAQNGSIRLQSLSSPKSSRSQYSNVKAKIDNKTPVCLLLKSQGLRSRDCLMQSNNRDYNRSKESSLVYDISKDSSVIDDRDKGSSFVDDRSRDFVEDPPGDKMLRRNSPNDVLLRKETRSLTTYSGSDSNHSSVDLHTLEGKVGFLNKKNIFEQTEETKNYFLKECATEFLSSFAKQMEEVSDLWLQLICDLIVTKMTIGKSASPRLSLADPKPSWRDEITKLFQSLPTQGELLQRKLCRIEEEQMNILRVVLENIVALIKEHKELKGKHSQLEDTYERTQSQLKEELAILGQENKELDQKYMLAIEKYELEKSKTEELEECQVEILKKMLELRKVVKHVEGKCTELERRGQSCDTSRLNLEECISNLETIRKKDNKKYDDLLKKHAESEKNISKLKQEIKESENSKTSLGQQVKELQSELTGLRAVFENSLRKRTKLEEEISDKNKKMKDLETELNLLKLNELESHENKRLSTDENNLELVKDLVNDVEKRNLHIQELKKKINRLEHMVREKSSREEKLLSHVSKLNKKCINNCTSLNNQIKELLSSEKSLLSQVSELEKVLGQKTLELDQRDRLIKELSELVRLKKESHPLLCQIRKHHCAEKLISAETDKESLSGRKKMIEMFSLLERKQMEIMKLERRIRGLQKFQSYKERTGIEQKEQSKDTALVKSENTIWWGLRLRDKLTDDNDSDGAVRGNACKVVGLRVVCKSSAVLRSIRELVY